MPGSLHAGPETLVIAALLWSDGISFFSSFLVFFLWELVIFHSGMLSFSSLYLFVSTVDFWFTVTIKLK